MNLRNAIREARNAHGWTQEQLAVKAGITAVYMNNIETGKKKPSVELTKRLCKLLGVDSNLCVQELYEHEVDALEEKAREKRQKYGLPERTMPVCENCGRYSPNSLPVFSIPILNGVTGSDLLKFRGDTYPREWIKETLMALTDDPMAFALRVQDNSMMPEFHEGQYVIVSPRKTPGEGDFVIAVNDSHKVIRRLHILDNRIVLQSYTNGQNLVVYNGDDEAPILGCIVEQTKRYI